jgi:hypothetical protein
LAPWPLVLRELVLRQEVGHAHLLRRIAVELHPAR